MCFAPGTTQEEIEELAQTLNEEKAKAAAESSSDTASAEFQLDDESRWSATATDGCCLRQGDPTTLTYSFVPDGTAIPSGSGEPAAPSNLFAFLNGIYGSPQIWMPLFHQVFAHWSERTGIHYVFQPSDDGAALPDAPGAIGVRGDVRISGHFINGDGGILAYNWFPPTGDMVIDTGEGLFDLTDNQSLFLRNVVAHEHGHGIGLGHTCPIDQSKLMEPVATTAFDGPQHDDTLAGQRGYGDHLENNDTAASSSDLGSLDDGAKSVENVSIDSGTDVDFYRFTVGATTQVSVDLTPTGSTYPQGPQNGDGSCDGATSFNSRAQADLAVDLLSSDGKTILATADSTPAGASERLTAIDLPSAGSYFVRVRARTSTTTQLYKLSLTPGASDPSADVIFEDGFESGDLSAWTTFRDGGGQLSVGPAGALDGRQGLEVLLGRSASSYVTDRSPDSESRYRLRFRLDATSYVPSASNARAQILKVYSSTPSMRWMIILSLRKIGDQTQVQARVRLDDGTSVNSSFLAMSDAPHAIEIDWEKSSAPGANDGHFKIWVDGTLMSTLGRLDNDLQHVKHTRFGVMGVSTAATGALRLDGFESRRQSYIGP